ncbi:MAG: 4Fe-4S ferredoxin [Candidatus Abyssobacteria bacterium SURF_17]|uniref:4Fe-4S ferredoxin n=1 Tax=Candidatus Abyssobacteria bacterium SURF_17 TaxID=2093361 RepID=A0A419F113_9BACT|nr:MAG: 4Fe-4S ferredoxin [Candidatus Abyssubacteria bacterium SURF_17]
MTDVYKRLAQRLDELPNGYPATESGVELKILKKIFTPEEAEMALKLRPMPETVEQIAERLGKPVPEMQKILDIMADKGEIGAFKMFGQQMYMLFPFVIGIYEFNLHRLDKELTELFEEYAPKLVGTVGAYAPAVTRVVPISTQINQDLHVHRHEDIRRMIDEAKSFNVMDCICKKERALEGHPCKHTLQICLAFSNEENAFEKFSRGRTISKAEAIKVMEQAEEEGLVHATYNVEEGQVFVCNCCSCCCGILRGVKEYKAPYILAKSYFVAEIDQDSCAACGVCKDERCPMDAIAEEDGVYTVIAERCIGCGVCTPTCPTESIKLVRKPESEHDAPPSNLIEWNVKRAASRGIEIKID